jgi:ABC-2 type transport system permease protein
MSGVGAGGAEGPRKASLHARKVGFLGDVVSVAIRALRSIPRDPEVIIPALIIPVFFYFVNVGALSKLTGGGGAGVGEGFDYKAFQIPTAILFAVTGISRANTVVTDIQTGYLDRLLMTPVNRLALLVGMMVADFVLVAALTIPVIVLGLITGVSFATGVVGAVVFVLIAAVWGLVFAGFPYAIALKTGNPAAVNTSFVIFFPFMFLTTAFVPKGALSGWLSGAADANPVTYLLEALRSLVMTGWDGAAIGKGLAATAGVGVVTMGLALLALRGRVARG